METGKRQLVKRLVANIMNHPTVRTLLAMSLIVAAITTFSTAEVYGQDGTIRAATTVTLDPTPDSVHVGQYVAFAGTLTSGGAPLSHKPVSICEDDPFVPDDCLASGRTDAQGRFVIGWTAEAEPVEIEFDIYAVFEGDATHRRDRSPNWEMDVLKYGGSITLDPAPSSARVGDVVTFSGTLSLEGRSPEGAIVYIKDEDALNPDDLLGSAYVDGAGRFTTYWIAADVDPDELADIYAVFEGNDRYYRMTTCDDGYTLAVGGLCRNTVPLLIYDDPAGSVPDADLAFGDAYMKIIRSLEFESSPRVAIVPSTDSYDEVRGHIASVREGITLLTAALEDEYAGDWEVEFEVIDRGKAFYESEPDIVVHLVTRDDDDRCEHYSGLAYWIYPKPVQALVCAGDGYDGESIMDTAAHEFIHTIGVGHAFNISNDLMCSSEGGVRTCPVDLSSGGQGPSSINLAAVVLAYGRDGFQNPNNPAPTGVFTTDDYRNAKHVAPLPDGDQPANAGRVDTFQFRHEAGAEIFLRGWYWDEYSGGSTVTITDPSGDIVDEFHVDVVDDHFGWAVDDQSGINVDATYDGFSRQMPGYYTQGTYVISMYDDDGRFSASNAFEIVGTGGLDLAPGNAISTGLYTGEIFVDRVLYEPGDVVLIGGFYWETYDGTSSIVITDPDGYVSEELYVYVVDDFFRVETYAYSGYEPGTYGVSLYDDRGLFVAYAEFELVAPASSSGVASVINAEGSSVPGCEETNECFVPYVVRIGVGDKVRWSNVDVAAHTVTSGVLADGGADGVFDSGLFVPGAEFSYVFEEAGEYPYFCLVHPWMAGIVVVE